MANVKMIDVAKAAGVSLATVGRVIHNNGYVAAEKREEIEQIIKDLGYIPNRMAQALKYSQSKLIGHMAFFNPNMLYEQISYEVHAAAARYGYRVMTIASHRDSGEEEKQIEELIGQRVEGIIITSNSSIDPSLIQKLIDNHIPIVMIERTLEMQKVNRIVVDDFRGAYEAVAGILRMGHQKVGFIGKELIYDVECRRYEGYRKALEDFNQVYDPSLVSLREEYSIAQGYDGMKALMNHKPTAVFMTSDLFACGVLQCLYENNIKVPEGISLVGYDNTLSTMLAPPIDSVGLPVSEIGELAMGMLLRCIENPDKSAETALIQTEYQNRGTVIKPRG